MAPMLVKPIDVERKNQMRLRDVTPLMQAVENVKNGLEYGEDLHITTGDDERGSYICFYTPNAVYSWKDFRKAWTSFAGDDRETNFHEGLTTNLRSPIYCHSGANFFEATKKGKDGLYQEITKSSHNEKGKLVNECEFLNGWELRVYDEKVQELFPALLSTFSWIDTIRVTYNREEILSQPAPDVENARSTYDPKIYYSLKFQENTQNPVKLFWQLGRKGCYQHIIQSNQFNKEHLTGFIVLTSIQQFANENRIEVKENVRKTVEYLIDDILDKHKASMEVRDLLKDYKSFATSMGTYIAKMCDVKTDVEQSLTSYLRELASSLNQKDDDPRLTVLKAMSNFIQTMKKYFGKAKEYRDRKAVVSEPKLFLHHSIRTEDLDSDDFHAILNAMEADVFKAFPSLVVGMWVEFGEPCGTATVSDFAGYQDEKLVVVDPSDIPLNYLPKLENKFPVVYPFDEYDYCYQLPSSSYVMYERGSQTENNHLSKFENVEALEGFGIKNGELEITQDLLDKLAAMPIRAVAAPKGDVKQRFCVVAPYVWHNEVRGAIPFLYDTKWEAERRVLPKAATLKRYNAWRVAIMGCVETLPQMQGIEVYPVFAHEQAGMYIAFRSGNIVAYNTAYWPLERKYPSAAYIMETAAHEIAHFISSNHGKLHTKTMEYILSECVKLNLIEKIAKEL